MVVDKFKLTFWGVFKDKSTEKEYLNNITSDTSAHNRVAILVAGIGFWVVTLADFAKLGLVSGFYISAIARTIFLAYCITAFFVINKKSTFRKTTILSFGTALGCSTLLLTVIYFLNPDKTIDPIDQITVPIVTLLLYIFMQIPLYMLFINGISVTVLYVLLIAIFLKNSVDNTINIIAILITLNFMGVYLNRFINISRRRDYANKVTIESLNESLKEEIEERKATQYNLEHALEQITDSIKYAQKIQFALLPSNAIIQQNFKESAILFRPKNIVSGDFYWLYKVDNKIVVAVADCTGHGIPGAFMSVLGISLLNDVIKSCQQSKQCITASEMLNQLRDLVIKSLKQSGEDSDRRDGMDMSLVIIDKEKKQIQYAGAYNPIWILHKEENQPRIIEFRGDKMPIGIHTKQLEPFNQKEIEYFDDDIIYMFTDGFKDQFGGPDGKKYLAKQFNELILSTQHVSLEEQRKILNDTFLQWKGEQVQVDDILVLAFKL